MPLNDDLATIYHLWFTWLISFSKLYAMLKKKKAKRNINNEYVLRLQLSTFWKKVKPPCQRKFKELFALILKQCLIVCLFLKFHADDSLCALPSRSIILDRLCRLGFWAESVSHVTIFWEALYRNPNHCWRECRRTWKDGKDWRMSRKLWRQPPKKLKPN